ncbi:universal stress protein [Streptomyces sp. NPDC007084]|uniref:universal stress protein n=1 Tax=Streptomyces sp. NPDC007084 TaxID=3154313 RepID=UPI003452D2F4
MAIRQVTVGVDGSLTAVRALDRAAEEAVLRGATLAIVYAVPDVDIAGPVLASAVLRVGRRCPDLAVTALAVAGNPVRALERHARHAELTVVGARALGPLAGLLLGSVSRRLAARIRGPLLVVRGDQVVGGGEVLLWPSKGADADAAAFAFAEAERRRTPVRVLDGEPAGCGPARRSAPGRPAAAPGDGTNRPTPDRRGPSHRARRGPSHRAGRGLLEATHGAGLVVISGRGHRGLPADAATRALLRHSHCPVVIVPDGTA